MVKQTAYFTAVLLTGTILTSPGIAHAQAAAGGLPGAGAGTPQTSAAPSAAASDAQSMGPQDQAASDAVNNEIVVTGSSIRGIAPTGSALTSVTRGDIIATGASTTTELLRSVPQLGSFGASGRNNGQNSANFVDQPAIHGVGVGNGGGGLTLVLVDGLRLPGAGINQTAPDPSAIPPSAIERVEIVADGASSIYGSDAVAGVVNFILRRNFNGAEFSGRVGFGDGYRTYNGSALVGKTWSTGSAMIDYEYSENTNINGTERGYYGQATPSTLCSPANVAVGSTTYGLSASGASASRINQCDVNKANDLYPAQHRHQGLVSLRQELAPGISVHARSIYSERKMYSLQAISGTNVSSGGLSVDVTSGPAYDFVRGLGVPAGTHVVTYNPSNDLGAAVRNRIATTTWSSNVGGEVDLGGDWRGSLDLNYGRERDDIYQYGIDQALVRSSAVNGALNPYGVGPANDPALLARIADYRTHYFGRQTVKEALAKLDGTLFSLPGGNVKAAVGGSAREERFFATFDVGREGAPVQNSALGKRRIYSVYGELFIPLFGDENGMAGLRKLDVSLSGRYDHYDDVGGTTNPKVGVNWSPARGVTVHGSFGTSFHAPSLADATTAIDTRVIRFADFTGAGSSAYSVILAGGNKLRPESATTWSLGFDLKPVEAPGLQFSASYFNIDYKDVITFPGFNPVSEPGNPIFDRYRVYAPTAAQVVAATAGLRHDGLSYPDVPALPTAIYDLRRQNFARQKIDGVDLSLRYQTAFAGGTISVGSAGTWLFGFNQVINGDTRVTSRLNTNYAVDLKLRSQIGWSNDIVDLTLFHNYTDGYRNTVDNSAISALSTFDLHAGLKLPFEGVASHAQLTLDVSNLFDKGPPVFFDPANGAFGFDPAVASPLGRVVSIGLRKSF